MTWKGRNEAFYAACNLRRVVRVFRWYNHGGRFTSRHKHNRSAFVCRRRARGQMERPLGNNWADVKHCGFAVSSLLPAEWDRKWKSVSAEWRQWEEQLMTGLLCTINRVSWWRWSTAWTQMEGSAVHLTLFYCMVISWDIRSRWREHVCFHGSFSCIFNFKGTFQHLGKFTHLIPFWDSLLLLRFFENVRHFL